MFIAFLPLADNKMLCVDFPDQIDGKMNGGAKVAVACILGDALISITALVVGIVGLVATIHGLPPAGSYTLISLSIGITLAWIIPTVSSKGMHFVFARDLLADAFSCEVREP